MRRIITILILLYFVSITHVGADEAKKKIIRVAALPYLSSAPLFIAEIKRYYEKQGLGIVFDFKKSAQAVAEAVADHSVDVGVTGLTSGFLQLAGSHELRILAGQYREVSGHTGSVFIAGNTAYHGGLNSVSELVGNETFGMTTNGSTFHHWFGVTVEKLHLSLAGFNLMPLMTVQAMRSALIENQVDLIISSSLIAHKMEHAGYGKIIGKVADYSPGQLGVVFTRQEIIDKKHDELINFLHAYKEACADYFNILIVKNDPEAFDHLLRAINVYLEPRLDLADAGDSIVYIDPEARYNESDLRETIAWYQKAGLVDQGLDIDRLFNTELLQEVIAESPVMNH